MPFDLQPVLKGEILELRPLRAEDFDDLFAVASDPLIWEQHPASDRFTQAALAAGDGKDRRGSCGIKD